MTPLDPHTWSSVMNRNSIHLCKIYRNDALSPTDPVFESNDLYRESGTRQTTPKKSPPLSSQILQSHPPSFGYMLLSQHPDQRLRHVPILQELTMGQNHHALLTPRQHHVRPPLVLHEPRNRRPDDRNYDVVLFVPLERVDVEHRVFPGEACGLEGVLDRVPLSVVRGDDSKVFSFSEVTSGDLDRRLDFSFVLNGG